MTGKQVAVVTGAARSIGAAVVRRLARDGWAVTRYGSRRMRAGGRHLTWT